MGENRIGRVVRPWTWLRYRAASHPPQTRDKAWETLQLARGNFGMRRSRGDEARRLLETTLRSSWWIEICSIEGTKY
jgi:hypothetical protein